MLPLDVGNLRYCLLIELHGGHRRATLAWCASATLLRMLHGAEHLLCEKIRILAVARVVEARDPVGLIGSKLNLIKRVDGLWHLKQLSRRYLSARLQIGTDEIIIQACGVPTTDSAE